MRRLLLGALSVLMVVSAVPAGAADYQIVDGETAEQGAYPWMAAMLFDGGQGCGASVIDPQWILTAAHCVADDRGQPSVTPEQVSFVVEANNWLTEGTELFASQIIIHPAYDALTTNNDIALVRLTEPTDVAPVTLAGPGDEALNDPPTVARVIGYGTTSSGGESSTQLLQVDVPVVDDASCQATGYDQLSFETMVCAGSPSGDVDDPGPDSCQGDSGGPLFNLDSGQPIQFGVVSFGFGCGDTNPGVYTQVTTFRPWIDGILAGEIEPGEPDPDNEQPDGAASEPFRVTGPDADDPVGNAIAVSQLVYQQDAFFGVLAASANFPDALGGSALASYYGPLLYVDEQGNLPAETLAEFQRTVPPGGTIYILGGEAVIGPEVQAELEANGFLVSRLGGNNRQETARLVAEEVVQTVNFGEYPPFDAAIVAFADNWPDAVAVGQISAWFGIPVLLTGRDQLGGPARDYLETYVPSNVIVLGGDAVISTTVRDQIAQISGPEALIELAGGTRLETSALVTYLNRFELYPANPEIFPGLPLEEPTFIAAVNLRRDDAFAHVLAASPLMGNVGGVFAPVDGDGSTVAQPVLDSVCGMDVQVLAIGGPSLVGDAALGQLQAASAGQGCAAG